jgi:hypothetical protein
MRECQASVRIIFLHAKLAPMRNIALLFLALAALAQTPEAKPAYQRVGNMSQIMINIVYPTSDAIFYVDRDEPKNEVAWNKLASQALMLAESGNLLLMPGRSRQQEKWDQFTAMMIEAGRTAFKAAQAKDIEGVRGVNDLLYRSCVECHQEYRQNYGRGRLPEKKN